MKSLILWTMPGSPIDVLIIDKVQVIWRIIIVII